MRLIIAVAFLGLLLSACADQDRGARDFYERLDRQSGGSSL